MTLPKEVREAMIAAVVENIGPVVGTPEYLARPGNVERLEMRRRNAAASHIDAALSALGEAGYALAKIEPTQAMVNAARATQYDDKSYSVLRVWDAMLAASQEGTK